jgi:hypothetical protein
LEASIWNVNEVSFAGSCHLGHYVAIFSAQQIDAVNVQYMWLGIS